MPQFSVASAYQAAGRRRQLAAGSLFEVTERWIFVIRREW